MAVSSSADIFQAKSEPLASLLPDIHNHKAALPNFQREWVWEPHMVKDLIVSVANRYPAGSLLTMQSTGETFALRAFSGSGTELKTRPSLMILDGQQRLTSLYQALYSKNGIRDSSGGAHFIYLDVKKLTEHPTEVSQQESTFADSIFTVPVNKHGQRLKYSGLRDFEDITSFEQEVATGALPLYTVFHPEELSRWRDKYIELNSEKDYQRHIELRDEWDAEVAPWLMNIRDYRFPVIELNRDMELHAICHIFEKVNSTGVPLTVFELCTAILWAQGLRLNDAWRETRNQLAAEQVLRMQGSLEGAMFLQIISLLDTLNSKYEAPDSRVAVRCRREDLLKLDKSTVEKWWETAKTSLRDASRFMETQGIIAQRILPYSTLLLPLAAILGFRKHQKGLAGFGQAWPKVERWYWCSVFSQRYSSSVETTAALDLEQVINWLDGGDEPEAVRTFSFSADRLLELNNIRNATYKGILCLLARNGARDFGGDGTLSVNLFYDSQQDHHHIFPNAALANLNVSDWRAQSIVNRTLISAAANRSIGGRSPSAYVETMKARLGEELTLEILRSHLIDPETLEHDDWEAFLLTRREELKELIHAVCGGQMQDFSDGKRVSLPHELKRLGEDVGAIEIRLRALIATALHDDWMLIPEPIRVRADERIRQEIRENPGIDQPTLHTMLGRLAYCDLRSLESIITNKLLWPEFEEVFKTKEMLSQRFRQLASLRNANAHLREVDDLIRSDAEAAMIWFRGTLNSAENNTGLHAVDIPKDDTAELDTIDPDRIDAVDLDAPLEPSPLENRD